MWVMTRAFLRSGLTEMVGANTAGYTGVLHNVKLGLAAAPFTPTPDLLLASITEANYTSYARQTVAWGGAYDDGTGNPTVAAVPSLLFQPSDAASPNTIYGHFLTNVAGNLLLGAELFNAPFNLPDQFSAINDTPVVTLNVSNNYGNSIAF
jgi:hypothetical protein